MRKWRWLWSMDTVFVSLFELIEASRRVHRFNAMSFSMRQQKLDKFCRGYKVLRSRLTKHCRWHWRLCSVQLLMRFVSLQQTGNDLQEDPTTCDSEPLNWICNHYAWKKAAFQEHWGSIVDTAMLRLMSHLQLCDFVAQLCRAIMSQRIDYAVAHCNFVA